MKKFYNLGASVVSDLSARAGSSLFCSVLLAKPYLSQCLELRSCCCYCGVVFFFFFFFFFF